MPERPSHNLGRFDPSTFDPLNAGEALWRGAQLAMRQPHKIWRDQLDSWQEWHNLWIDSGRRWLGQSVGEVKPDGGDRRFDDAAWHANPWFSTLRQGYLLAARQLLRGWQDIEHLAPADERKIDFFLRQIADAAAPSNYLATNPRALRKALETRGASVARSWRNLLRDFDPDSGQLKISQTDQNAFELGVNIATTPGKVVFQNDMIQLLQYEAQTTEVEREPILIVPPWINKYYILDLQPENSFIRWLVGQGHTVFVVSWVNPDSDYAQRTFDDYLVDGTVAAMHEVARATGERQCHAIGYCLGGTLLAATLAWLEARGQRLVASATFLTTLIDFAEPGELGVFIDEHQVQHLEQRMDRDGYLDGSDMAATFSALRANDLVWSFFISNYLMGRDPLVFDLLYWNADSTRMPAAMHSFYLRRMYMENALREPDALTLAGTPIDIRRIQVPCYFLSAQEDHIAPWRSTFQGAALPGGPVRFVLGESGHIAGVVNPPEQHKYGYRTNDAAELDDADGWLAGSERRAGSWWLDWQRWRLAHGSQTVAARTPGEGELDVIEDAPGSYVRVRTAASNRRAG